MVIGGYTDSAWMMPFLLGVAFLYNNLCNMENGWISIDMDEEEFESLLREGKTLDEIIEIEKGCGVMVDIG